MSPGHTPNRKKRNDSDGQTEPEPWLNFQPKTVRFYNTKHLAGTLAGNIIEL